MNPSLHRDPQISSARYRNALGLSKFELVERGVSRLTVLGVCLLSVLLVFLIAEGAVRIRQYVKYGSARGALFKTAIDSRTGLPVPIANQVTGTIRINSLGFRGPEILQPKPADDIRLAFLGASTNFCAENSSNAATWPDLVWRSFQQSDPDLKWDYINAGVPGYTVEQSLKDFRERVAPLQPDVIIIYHSTNDLSWDTRELARQKLLFSGKVDGYGWLAQYSVLIRLIELNTQVRQRQQLAMSGKARLTYDPVALSVGFHQHLGELVRAAQQFSPVVAVATFSIKLRREQSPQEQLHSAESSLYYMPYMSIKGLLDGFDQYNRVIRDVALETGAVLIDGENDIPGDDVHFNDSVHFKDPGSAAMARRVESALRVAPVFQRLRLERRQNRKP